MGARRGGGGVGDWVPACGGVTAWAPTGGWVGLSARRGGGGAWASSNSFVTES